MAGASGVLGVRVVRLLLERGHEVAGMTRTPAKASSLQALGAVPVVCDVYDREALTSAVASFAPEAVLHLITDLPDDAAQLRERAPGNARIRREGTRNLIDAAQAAGTGRFIAQSVAWTLAGDGAAAVEELEAAVLAVGGTVIRYGQFYGEGTYHAEVPPPPPRVHIDEAARVTADALGAGSGIVTAVEPT